jgi:hypothetical protein
MLQIRSAMTLTRSAWRPRVGRTVRSFVRWVALPGALAIGAWIASEPRSVAVVPVVSPIYVTVPAAPAPTIVVAQPTLPPPLPPPPPPPARVLRVLAPSLDAECALGIGQGATACEWERGFPAISADGRLIAREAYLRKIDPHDAWPDSQGLAPESMGYAIHFFDAGSLKLVRSVTLLAAAERDGAKDVHSLRTRVTHRVADLQRLLEAQRYRSMESLVIRRPDEAKREVAVGVANPYAEVVDDALRIIDASRSAVLWQHRFAFPTRDSDGDSGCFEPSHRGFDEVWWDGETRTILIEQSYKTGGCMCPTGGVTHVHRIH